VTGCAPVAGGPGRGGWWVGGVAHPATWAERAACEWAGVAARRSIRVRTLSPSHLPAAARAQVSSAASASSPFQEAATTLPIKAAGACGALPPPAAAPTAVQAAPKAAAPIMRDGDDDGDSEGDDDNDYTPKAPTAVRAAQSGGCNGFESRKGGGGGGAPPPPTWLDVR
jgi:hypothetical protein